MDGFVGIDGWMDGWMENCDCLCYDNFHSLVNSNLWDKVDRWVDG